MQINLKKEVNKFLKDIKENIKDAETLKYVEKRSLDFLDTILNSIDDYLEIKDKQIKELEEHQKMNDEKLIELSEMIETINRDIYEEESDFSVICPYCNFEFDADVDEDCTEIICPECNNLIELDWDGNLDDDDNNGCQGNCSGCQGCE